MVNSVEITGVASVQMPSDPVTYTAAVAVTEGEAETVTWASSDEDIATVTAGGVVTFLDDGTVTITATSTVNTEVSDSIEVTVLPVVVTVTGDASVQAPFADTQYTAVVTIAEGEAETVTWSTSDVTKATVDETGLVTFLDTNGGTVKVRATSTVDETAYGEITVTMVHADIPEMPKYMTGAWVHTYISTLADEVQKRFVDEQTRTGIEVPNTEVPLRTAQIELVMCVI